MTSSAVLECKQGKMVIVLGYVASMAEGGQDNKVYLPARLPRARAARHPDNCLREECRRPRLYDVLSAPQDVDEFMFRSCAPTMLTRQGGRPPSTRGPRPGPTWSTSTTLAWTQRPTTTKKDAERRPRTEHKELFSELKDATAGQRKVDDVSKRESSPPYRHGLRQRRVHEVPSHRLRWST